MRYISLFSGIEAATVAWKPLGWEPIAFSEIEPFPCEVLKRHYPEVPNLGDITNVNWKGLRGKADVVVGGSPCQSFSIAGRREGLAGESGLMFEYIRAVREIRPRWFVWENVPGAFSVERGEAFRQLLSEMDKLGYGMAWRVLDAQFFGVAQRRRRVFLVGHLGDMRASDVLFEPESMRGDSPSSREKREELSGAARIGTEAGGFKFHAGAGAGSIGYDVGSAPTLTADWHQPAVISMSTANTNANGSNISDADVAYTLDLANSNAIAFAQNTRDEVRLVNGDGSISGALAAQPGMKQTSYVCIEDAPVAADEMKQAGVLAMSSGQANSEKFFDMSPTLNCNHEQPIIAIDCRNSVAHDELSGTLQSKGNGGYSLNYQNHVAVPVDDDGGCYTPWDCQSRRIHSEHDALPAIYAGEGGGHGYVMTASDDKPMMLKIRCGSGTYTKQDGSIGTAGKGALVSDDAAFTLAVTQDQTLFQPVSDDGGFDSGNGDSGADERHGKARYIIRRLTPVECERLQGFPDGYTDIPYKGKEHPPDTARYKALGNSFCVNVIRWIGERIQDVEETIL